MDGYILCTLYHLKMHIPPSFILMYQKTLKSDLTANQKRMHTHVHAVAVN